MQVITSQEKEVQIEKVNGEKTTVLVRVWNETIANLTLMALGSSAPEILLSVIEICGNNFIAGDLGPRFVFYCTLKFFSACLTLYKKIFLYHKKKLFSLYV